LRLLLTEAAVRVKEAVCKEDDDENRVSISKSRR